MMTTTDSQIDLCVTADYRLAQDWELVLLSQGLSPDLRQGPEGYVLSVPRHQENRARAGLIAYQSENSSKLEKESASANAPGSLAASAFAGIGMLVFYAVTTEWTANLPWFERGSADALRILHGELWRAVTALTLHADVVHASGNAVGVALFLYAVCSAVGTGVGPALVLLSGAAGNLANAYFHGDPHVSLGASTAVFGAIGILASLSMVRRRRTVSSKRRAWLPTAAAMALLAMLGTGGQRVDVWAHLFGLFAGALFGIAASYVTFRPPRVGIQWACGAACVAVLISSWMLALR